MRTASFTQNSIKKSQMRVNESLSTLVSQQERLLIYLDRLLGDKFDDGFEKRILLNRKQFGPISYHHIGIYLISLLDLRQRSYLSFGLS